MVIDGHTVETPALFAQETTSMIQSDDEVQRIDASSASSSKSAWSLPKRFEGTRCEPVLFGVRRPQGTQDCVGLQEGHDVSV